MSRFSFFIILAIAFCVLGLNAVRATTISITTTQSGGVYNIDATQSAIWNITISEAGAAAGLSVVSGNFSLKRDNGATDPVVFSFYRGFSYNSTGGTQLLGSASVAPGAIPTNAFPAVLFTRTYPKTSFMRMREQAR